MILMRGIYVRSKFASFLILFLTMGMNGKKLKIYWQCWDFNEFRLRKAETPNPLG